ncbi:MAG: 3-oxoacyl-ACP reductase [Acidiferrobacteraceae bacterium]|nr:3-oxoacyl-ACP reductase [Acidiferrobacteraceae bacterium]
MNNIDLAGRTAVVTGGAQGIGLAIATRLANSGAQISIWDRDAKFLEKAIEGFSTVTNINTQTVELTEYDSVQSAVEIVKEACGSIDIFVNNAGIAGPTMPSWEYSIDDWLEVINIDLNAVYYCCRAVVPLMRDQNYGRIVNVASIAGKEGNPNAAAYSSAKAAVIALTKSISKETADKNIAVNCITPAAAKTRIFDQISQEHIDYMLSKIPRGRFVLVEEVAAMVAWLVSEENSFTTGAVFDLSGGRATY